MFLTMDCKSEVNFYNKMKACKVIIQILFSEGKFH